MGLTEDIARMAQMQNNFDKCTVCKKVLPPGTGVNKLYDDELGEITTCVGCSLKAILWYIRNLYKATK